MAETAAAGAAQARLLPHNLEAERAVLGSMIVNPETIGTVAQALKGPGGFYKKAHQTLYELLVEMYDRHRPIDLLILLEELAQRGQLEQVGGREAVMDLMLVDSPAHAEYYAEIVRQRAVVRSLIQAGHEIVRAGQEESHDLSRLIDHCERSLYLVTQERASSETHEIGALVDEAMDVITAMHREQKGSRGLLTGLHELDQLTAGLQRAELAILAARPSMGKTSLAVNIAEHVAFSGTPTAVFSLEVNREQLVRNMLCSLAEVNSHDLRQGKIGPPDYEALCEAAGRLEKARILVNDTPGLSITSLRTAARRMKQNHDIGLVVVDYLQLMEASSAGRWESRQQEITEISRGLKSLARELEVAVLALSQLNRKVEDREGHKPRMSDLRESGSIEQEADLILFLYRDEYYFPDSEKKGIAEITIAKQRHGPTGSLELQFTPEYMRFRNLYQYEKE